MCFHQLYFLTSRFIIMLFQVIYSALILCSTVHWLSCVIDCSLDLPSLNLSPLPPFLVGFDWFTSSCFCLSCLADKTCALCSSHLTAHWPVLQVGHYLRDKLAGGRSCGEGEIRLFQTAAKWSNSLAKISSSCSTWRKARLLATWTWTQ